MTFLAGLFEASRPTPSDARKGESSAFDVVA